jgi:hydroxymethylcytosylglucuronate/cytosylglucuronate synthase
MRSDRTGSMVPAGGVLVAVSDFGWGSVGKLQCVLDELGEAAVALDEESTTARLSRQLLSPTHHFRPAAEIEAKVALVINDPVAADRISATGAPVVYVDSLPYLRATDAEVPHSVAVYCAQRTPAGELPPGSPLRDVPELRWIDPIVPRSARRRGGAGVVVSVGGLHSHLSGDAVDHYLRAVVVPLAESLASTGRQVAAICGNLPAWACAELARILPGTRRIGAQPCQEFHETLRHADVLFSPPGSTTILQATTLRLPVILLPAQNLSQLLHARMFAEACHEVVDWPSSVIDMDVVQELRPKGEDVVLTYVYGRIRLAANLPEARAVLRERLAAAARSDVPQPSEGRSSRIDSDGAAQVARLIRQALFAPLRGRRAL